MRDVLVDYLEGLRSAETVATAAASFGRLWQQAGFDLTFVARLRGQDPADVAVETIHGSWPDAEKARYVALRCWEFDPLVCHCLSSDTAHFVHNDGLRAQSALLPRHRRVLQRDFSAQWPARAVVPARDRDGTIWMLAAAGRLSQDELADTAADCSDMLTVSAWACEARIRRLTADGPTARRPNLTERERDCLTWLAMGLRNDRIADRLGISNATVEMHLRNARRKLGARTREQAVARAVSLGMIDF